MGFGSRARVGRDERGQEALLANAGALKLGLVVGAALLLLVFAMRARKLPFFQAIGLRQPPGGDQQSLAALAVELGQLAAIVDQAFEHAQALVEVGWVDGHANRAEPLA